MKSLIAALLISGLFVGSAMAGVDNGQGNGGQNNGNQYGHDKGGNGGNGGQGGQGGQGGNGGQGGQGGNAYGQNKNSNHNNQGQGQSQTGINGQGQTQGLVNQPGQTIEGDNVKVYAPAPSIGLPALAVAPETCMGSVSAGGSGGNGMLGVSLGFGYTWKSRDCELRMYARALQMLGANVAAIHLLAQNEDVARALDAAYGTRFINLVDPVPAPAAKRRDPEAPVVTFPDPREVSAP